MPPYTIRCYEPNCPNEAAYKIAARWTDGVIHELKTYGLTCESCLTAWFRRSLAKEAACRRAANERIDRPGIYRLERGKRDQRLKRLEDLEAGLLAGVKEQ